MDIVSRFPRILLIRIVAGALLMVAGAGAAAAQGVPGFDNAISERQVRIGENRIQLSGQVELKRGDIELYANEVEIFTDSDRAVATGNVVLVQTGNRIAAERVDFNTKTRLGTFYRAYGFANIKPQVPRPGAVAVPNLSSQETDVYFQGETVEKIGPKKYKITNGGFTTCVQPTPRWELHAGTVVLSIDNYTLLRSAVFSVKGVPMLYVPVLYYPTKKEDRATGILIPTYGSSDLRGQSLHNAFFWVLGRSQDLTFEHVWYSKTGQGGGSEYRYNFGPGSNGDFRGNFLDEHEADLRRRCGKHHDSACQHELGAARRRQPGAARQPSRARPRGLFLEPRPDAVRPDELRQRVPEPTIFWGQRGGGVAQLLAERDGGPHGLLLEPDGLEHERQLAQGRVVEKRTADPGHADVLLGRR